MDDVTSPGYPVDLGEPELVYESISFDTRPEPAVSAAGNLTRVWNDPRWGIECRSVACKFCFWNEHTLVGIYDSQDSA